MNTGSRSSSTSRANPTETDGKRPSSTPPTSQESSSSPFPPPSNQNDQQEQEGKDQKPKPTPAEMVMILGKLIQEGQLNPGVISPTTFRSYLSCDSNSFG